MLKILLTIAGGYLLLVAFVYTSQSRMLYLPNLPGRSLDATPFNIGVAYEDVSFVAEDGVALHGWFVPGRTERVLLFFHGNAGNISHRLESIRQFLDLGLTVFIVDYRGYGQSEGRTSEAGLYKDGSAAWRYLTETMQVRPDNIVIFGRSLGGSVAAHLAMNVEAAGLVVESSFTSVPDIASDLYPWLPARWLSRLRHATGDYVRDVDFPVLVVHSRDDEIIPIKHGEAIYAAATEPRSLLVLRGGHNDAFIRDEENYLEGLRVFLDSLYSPNLLPTSNE